MRFVLKLIIFIISNATFNVAKSDPAQFLNLYQNRIDRSIILTPDDFYKDYARYLIIISENSNSPYNNQSYKSLSQIPKKLYRPYLKTSIFQLDKFLHANQKEQPTNDLFELGFKESSGLSIYFHGDYLTITQQLNSTDILETNSTTRGIGLIYNHFWTSIIPLEIDLSFFQITPANIKSVNKGFSEDYSFNATTSLGIQYSLFQTDILFFKKTIGAVFLEERDNLQLVNLENITDYESLDFLGFGISQSIYYTLFNLKFRNKLTLKSSFPVNSAFTETSFNLNSISLDADLILTEGLKVNASWIYGIMSSSRDTNLVSLGFKLIFEL